MVGLLPRFALRALCRQHGTPAGLPGRGPRDACAPRFRRPLPTAHCSLLTAHCPPPTAHRPPLPSNVHFALGGAARCDFFWAISPLTGTMQNFSQVAALVASVWRGSLLAASPLPPPPTAVR